MAFISVSPTTVRDWFASQGTPIKATGRISDENVRTYNKANKGRRYVPTEYKGEAVKVTAKPEKGRAVTRTLYVNEVRAQAQEVGVQVGKRGRLPREVMEAAALGTLSTLAQATQEAASVEA